MPSIRHPLVPSHKLPTLSASIVLAQSQVVADGGFTNHESVIAMHARDIEFFGSFGERRLRRPKAKRGGVDRAELFTHDAKADHMICPENKRLRLHYFDRQPGRTIRLYIARKEECHVCPSRQACCGK